MRIESSKLMQPVRQAWRTLASKHSTPSAFASVGPSARKCQSVVPAWLNASTRRPDMFNTASANMPLSDVGRGIRRSSTFDEYNIFSGIDSGSHTVVQSYTDEGFVVNKTLITGAMILLPQTYLHWNVNDIKDVTWESLSIIRLLAVKPGDTAQFFPFVWFSTLAALILT
jgi:hypothetical protein